MTDKKNFTQGIKKRIVRTILWTSVALLLVLAILISALQIPYIQTKVVQKLTTVITEKIHFPVSIGYVNLRWFDKLLLEDVVIKDTQGEEMISVESLLVDFEVYKLLDTENINIDEAEIFNSKVKLIKNSDSNGLNINQFIRNLREWLASGSSGKKSPVFSIDHISIENSQFVFNDPFQDSIRTGFDYYHFSLNDINLEAEDFKIVADTLELNLRALTAKDQKTDLKVQEMNTFFRLSQKSMQFLGLMIKANESIIRDTVIFNYDNTEALSYFQDSVSFEANLDAAVIYSKDLALFAPYLQKYEESYRLSGHLEGMVRNFSVDEMELAFGENSLLKGNISFDGLPNFQETFIEGDLKNSVIAPQDIAKYVTDDVYRQARKLGKVNLSASFVGFPNDFVANGAFYTEIGNIVSDINLKIDETTKRAEYSGSLSTLNFNLGKMMDRPDLVQLINMRGNISGSGFQLENADFNLKATIDKLGFKNYVYTNINTDARLAKSLFEGALSINDPNLRFSANGNIDLRNNVNKINIKARLDTALLKPLNLSQKEIIISTVLDLDIRGLEIDSIRGIGNFTNSYVYYEGKELALDSLNILSLRDENQRIFALSSDVMELHANGDFEFTELYSDLERLIREYKLNFENNQQEILKYYAEKEKFPKEKERYSLDFQIKLLNLNPVTNLFLPDLYLSEDTKFEGAFTGGYTSILSLNGFIDTLQYDGVTLYDSQLELNTSKIADSTNVLAMAYVFSPTQKLKGLVNTKDLLFEGVWMNNHIDFRNNLTIEEDQSYIQLRGDLEFLTNKTQIAFDNSELFAIGKPWDINPDNKIIIQNNEIYFENLKFFHDEQNITVNGAVSDSLDKKLTVEINNFDVSNLNPLISYNLGGEINGYLEIQNLYKEVLMECEMAISDFKIEEFLVGNLSGLSKWSNSEDRLNIEYQIDRLSTKIMDLKGYIQPQNESEQLNIQAKFNQANINIAEPFIKEVFSEIRGVASGEFQIAGMIDYPILTGEGEIKNGGFKLNYLNTVYTFDSQLLFDANEIGVRDLILFDENSNKAILNGGIFHDGFRNFVIDLEADMNNFQVLNTLRPDNSLYYGNANVTGTLNVLGAINNLNFEAQATTNKGTKLFIPIESTSGVQQEAYINFINLNDSARTVSLDNNNQLDLKGINLDFDIDITPDAYTEIIFDLQAGDIIRGRGNGKINLLIDTNGDFNMFGDYEFVEGGYNFTLYNVINKEFNIEPGSRINWIGDPYEGILDIKASYDQMASLAPLLNLSEDVEIETAALKRRYPAEVILELDGPLLSPEISFDINVSNYPENLETPNGQSLGNVVNLFLSRINLDRQERERQVFSLIVLRQFSPENSFNTSGSFGSSVSELFSNQLSYWITQVDENLEIDVDLSGLDADAFNTFQLRLSYSFFDGRLRITRDGSFTDVENETNTQSLLGEWTVEYFLTKSGKFRAKVYNRNNYNYWNNDPNSANRNTTFSGGLSLLHVTSFNNLKELFSDFQKNNLEELLEEAPEKEENQDKSLTNTVPAIDPMKPEEELKLSQEPLP